MTTKGLLQFIDTELKSRGDEAYAAQMNAYMKDNFDHYGVRGPLRSEVLRLVKPEVKSFDIDQLVDYATVAWREEKREHQHLAMDLLKWRRTKLEPKHLPTLEQLIISKSWWDTVDMIAPNMAGEILSHDKDLQYEWAEAWINSDNMWLRRSAIIHQLRYKGDVDKELLW